MSPADNDSFVQKRLQVGLLSAGCLTVGGVGTLTGHGDSVWAGPCVRIGVLLGALWFALPAQKRRTAGALLSRSSVVGLILVAIFLPRLAKLRFALPLLLVGILLGWLIRPRLKRK